MLHLHSEFPQRDWTPPVQALTPAEAAQAFCLCDHVTVAHVIQANAKLQPPKGVTTKPAQSAHMMPANQQQVPAIPPGGMR